MALDLRPLFPCSLFHKGKIIHLIWHMFALFMNELVCVCQQRQKCTAPLSVLHLDQWPMLSWSSAPSYSMGHLFWCHTQVMPLRPCLLYLSHMCRATRQRLREDRVCLSPRLWKFSHCFGIYWWKEEISVKHRRRTLCEPPVAHIPSLPGINHPHLFYFFSIEYFIHSLPIVGYCGTISRTHAQWGFLWHYSTMTFQHVLTI